MKANAGEVYTVYNQYLKRYTACQVAYIAPPDTVSEESWGAPWRRCSRVWPSGCFSAWLRRRRKRPHGRRRLCRALRGSLLNYMEKQSYLSVIYFSAAISAVVGQYGF